MPLDTAGDANKILTAMNGSIANKDNAGSGMLPIIASVLDAGFQMATPTLASIDITPPTGTLVIPPSPGPAFPDIIGQACADYWSLAIGLGSPQKKTSVDKVVNDAAKIATPIAANIRALAGKGYLQPYYFDFVDAIHKEVLTIIWDVTESNPLTSVTYPVNVT